MGEKCSSRYNTLKLEQEKNIIHVLVHIKRIKILKAKKNQRVSVAESNVKV